MKKLAVLFIVVSASLARADLIDLTPGGFSGTAQPFPAGYQSWLDAYYNARPQHLSVIPASLFTVIVDGPTATISWDTSGLLAPTGGTYLFKWFGVSSEYATGDPNFPYDFWVNFYEVTPDSWISGTAEVTVNGIYPIEFITTLGQTTPDVGSTFLLLILSLLILAAFQAYNSTCVQ